MNAEKLAKLQAQVRTGGKGSVRRKVKKVQKPVLGDEQKLEAALKKLNTQPMGAVEEVNMFRKDGKILHFPKPQVQASLGSNTFVVKGPGFVKELIQMIQSNQNIISQLGPEALAQLQQLAAQYQAQMAAQGQQGDAVPAADDEDDIPDLVEANDDDEVPELVEEVD